MDITHDDYCECGDALACAEAEARKAQAVAYHGTFGEMADAAGW